LEQEAQDDEEVFQAAEEIDVVDLMEPREMVPMDESTESDSNSMPPLIDDDEIVQPLADWTN
jgi:hypothetical protein